MNSSKPTKMQAHNLPSAAVCAIIEACGKAGVRVFKYGELYFSMDATPQTYPLIVPGDRIVPAAPDHARQNADTLERDEDEVRDEQLRMLMLENPMEYERQLRDGELEDEPSEPNDGETR